MVQLTKSIIPQNKAFATSQRGSGTPTEAGGFYKSRGPGLGYPGLAFRISALENDGDGVPGAGRGDYKEYVDKSHPELSGKPWPECASWALGGECESGHQFWKVIMCGKEWCPDCGEDGSWIHKRREARWLPKIQQLESYGYYVIEWPIESRGKLRSKEALSRAGKQVKGAFKTLGYDRGLRRWHWFGDDNPGDRGWNPHLNLIVPGRYLPETELERVKAYLRYVLHEPDLIVHYSYRQTVPEMLHGLRYITRATFWDKGWDPAMVEVVDGFHNSQTWGRWDGPRLWGLDDDRELTDLEQGTCPICGEPITWDSKPMPIIWLALLDDMSLLKEIKGGYFYQDSS